MQLKCHLSSYLDETTDVSGWQLTFTTNRRVIVGGAKVELLLAVSDVELLLFLENVTEVLSTFLTESDIYIRHTT